MRQTLIKLSCSICLLLTPITSSATSYLFYKWLPNLYINFTNDRNSSQPPTVTFSFNNDNTCEGTDIQFTSNVSGENGAITYSWNFGDGGTSTDANPIYAYNNVTNGCGTQTYTVSLVVTDNDGPHTAVTNTVSVIRSPNLTIEDDDNPFGEPFNNCASASPNFEINVDVGSSDSSCIDTYMVDWGDGSPTETFNSLPTTPVNHIYTQIGLYSMTWTATSDDGCITEVTTIVKNVSNPSGAVVSPGNTNNLCAPTELLQFTITNWGQNSDDTTYDIDFGDGTTISLNQATLQASPYYDAGDPENSADYPIPHAYLASSCESGSGYTIELNITNACDTTTSQLVDITVLTGADADFDWTGDQCVNNTILFSSTSELGYNPNCTQNAIYNWDFGDGTVLTDVGANESHTYTNPGTYNVTMSVEMYCGISEITRQICIEDTPAPLFNLSTLEGCIPLNVNATNTTVATACSATSYLWDVTYTAANCETVENWQFVGGTDQTSENPQFQFYNAGFYDITLTATNNCGTEVSSSQRISVKRPPTANINPIPNYCGAVTINPTTNIEICTDDPSEVTYNWSFPGGTPASSNSENPGSINYSTPGNHTVTLEVTNSCGTVTTNETFTIVEQPNITVQPLANQTLCQNATPTDLVVTATASTGTLTYQWYVNSVNNTTTGAPIAGATNATYTPPTNAVGILYYYVIVSQQAEPSCNQVSTIAEVEVLTAPIFTVQPDDSAVCLNGTPNILEVAYTNGTGTPTYQWYSNTVDSTTGGTLIPGATNATYNPPTTSIGTLYYYCVISFTSGGCSQIFSETAQVDVTPGVSIDTQPTPTQDICIDGVIDTALTVTHSGGTGTISYQWYSNTTNSNTGGTLIPGATSDSYTPPATDANTPGTLYYYVEVSITGNGCAPAASNVAVINVVNDPVVDTQPLASQSLCQSATPTDLTVVASGGIGTFSYQWYSNTTNTNTGGTLIPGATSDSYTPPTSTVGTLYYYVVISQSPGSLDCEVVSNTAAVEVLTAPIFTVQPDDSAVCLNGTPNILEVAYTNGTGTPTYQWYSNTVDSTTGGTLIPSATNATYNPPTTSIGTLYYYCVISFTSGGCSQIFSETAQVDVTPGVSIDTQPTPTQDICIDGVIDTALTVTHSGGTGTISYQWYSNTTNSNTGGTLIPGATSDSYTPPATDANTPGTLYYYVEVSITGNGCAPAASNVAVINVVNDPVVDTQPLASQSLCQSATPTDLTVVASGGIGTFSYQWYSNTTNTNTGGTLIPGATSDSYTPPTSTVGTLYYYVVISQSPGSLDCEVVSNTAAVEVLTAPIFTVQPDDSAVCLNGTPNILEVAYTNGTGTPTYQWYSNTVDSTTGGTLIPGATNATYNPPTTSIGTLYYYCVISFTSGGCSQIFSETAQVDVTPGVSIDTQPTPTQDICIDGVIDTALTVTHSGGTGTISYQWYSNTTNSNTGGTLIPGATSDSYTPPATDANTPGTLYYYVEVSITGNGCAPAASNVAVINVVNDPVVDTQPLASQSLCQSATPTDLTVVASGGIGTFSYQWYSNTTNTNTGGTLIPGATSDSYTPPTSTVGTLYYYVVISQSPGSLDCEVVSNTAAVITTTAPIINTQPQSSQVCENESATILQVDYLNGTGTPSYQWFSNNTNSTIGAVAIGGANTSSYDPPTSTLGITYYYCEITFTGGGCPSVLSDFASVDVNQTPDVPNYNDDICSGLTYNLDFTTIPGAIIPAGTTFSWSAPSIVPAGSVTGTTDGVAETSLSQTLTNTTNLPATVTYTITPTAGICIGNDFDVTITVNPGISVIADISNSACFGSDNAGIDITISGGTPISPGNPFNILWTGPNGFSATTEDISNLEPGTYNLNIQDGTSCVFNQDYVITEPTLLTIQEDNLNHISCFGANDGSIEITFLGGTPNYTYAWTTTNGSGLIPTQEDQSGLGPGNYTLTLTDANNCVTTQDFEIIEPIELLISETHNQLLCFGDNNGFILVNVDQLSIAPFTYALTGTDYLGNAVSASFTTTNPSYQFDNLVAGIYQIVVTDVNGCFKEIGSINITQPDGITISYTKVDETCYGAMDGAITLNVSGGTGSFTYDWSDFGSGPIRTNLSAGIYTVIVTDESGCSQSESIEITSPEFHIEPVVSNISCFGANDGFIHLNIIGGVLPITVTWADDPTAGAERNNLPAGTYSVYITDSDSPSCPIDRTFTITEPAALNLSGNVTNALDCDIVESGAINLLVTGGTLPMEINWSNGATTEDLDNIPPGDYTVLVTDANGCEETRTFNVFRPDALELDVETTVFADCDLRQTLQRNELIINGGVPPFNIVWSRGDIDPNTPTVMTTNESGVVLVDVTDSLGCMQQFVFDVDLQDIGFPDFEFTSFGFETYGTFSIDDPIFFTNTSTGDPISIQWNFGDQSQPSDVFSPEHIYNNVGRYAVTLTVQYDYDCTYSVTKQIEITQGYDIILPTAFTPNQDGINDTMRPSFFGLQEMEMSVFDTWGEKIYYENSLSLEGWDGSIKGEDAENGNYVIAVKAVTFYGKEITLNAPITLLR